jgi:hypothetical protein
MTHSDLTPAQVQERTRGEVRAFRESHHPQGNLDPVVWTFYLERFRDGVPLAPVSVQMRGSAFRGSIHDGDTVELYDNWQEGTLLETRRVYNRSAGIEVRALTWFEAFLDSARTLWTSGAPVAIFVKALLLLLLLLSVVFLCVAAAAFWQVITGAQAFDQEFCRLAPVC